jgi:hypothetical protein
MWPVGHTGPKTHGILKCLEGSVGPDSILLIEGCVLDPVTYRRNFADKYGGGGGDPLPTLQCN